MGEERPRSPIVLPRLERNVDRQSGAAGISAVEQVITVATVVDVNIVGLIPGWTPILRIRIHDREPMAAELEARVAALIRKGKSIDTEPVSVAIVDAEIVVGNPVATIAAARMPIAVFGLPMAGATLLPVMLLVRALHLLDLAKMTAIVA